jgi:predicted dehydrogenase
MASRRPDNAARAAAELGVPFAAASYSEAIRADVDAFYVAVPPSEHAALALQCIAAGKPVLIEKPFALDARAAAEIVTAARSARVFCMEAMWMRFLPAVAKAKSIMEAGGVGEIRSVSGSFGVPASPATSPSLFAPELGGGALMHRGVYPLSLASFFIGPVKAVSSRARRGKTGVDEDCTLVAEHASGGLSTSYSSLSVNAENDLVIRGDRGVIRLEAPVYRPFRISISKSRGGGSPTGGRLERLREGAWLQGLNQRASGLSGLIRGGRAQGAGEFYTGNGYGYEAEEVAHCVRAGMTESDIMPLSESLSIMEAIDAARAQWS